MKKTTRIVAALGLASIMTALVFVMNGCGAPADGSGGVGDLPVIESNTSYAMGTGEGECSTVGGGGFNGMTMVKSYQGTGTMNSAGAYVGYYEHIANPSTNYSSVQTSGTYIASYPLGTALTVSSTATDGLSVAERTLMQSYGCSAPVYFEGYEDDGSQSTQTANPAGFLTAAGYWTVRANGHALLCPVSSCLQTYVQGLGKLYNSAGRLSDTFAHYAGETGSSIFTGNPAYFTWPSPTPQMLPVPSTPNGWVWVVAWQDPNICSYTGCMTYI